MADLFVRDLAALDERCRTGLRSLAATEARVLSAPPETAKMKTFRNRPLLAVLLVLGLVGVASAGAYAVDRVLLTIDPDKSAPEIERDVKSQLEQAGVADPAVAATKTDGKVEVTIASSDPTLPQRLRDMGAIVLGADGSDSSATGPRRIVVEGVTDGWDPSDARTKRLTAVLSSAPVITALQGPDAVATIERELVTAGFHDIEVVAAGADIVVKVKAPPTP